MGLTLVFHDTESPALYGAVAASIAVTRGFGFMHVAARFDTTRHADAEQHVVRSGGLVGSGLLWFERLSGKPVSDVTTVDVILEAAQLEDLVVPIHPALLADADVLNRLMVGAQSRKIAVETITVSEDAGCFRDTRTQAALAWRDRFGRISLEEAAAPESAVLTIGLIGAQSDHRNVYPAVLACIADAADSLSIPVDIRFVEPFDDHKFEDPLILEGISAILLPGGADMKNVRGQIAAAALTLQSGLPTVGLCLGMQTMVTAVAWKAFGRQNANLAEADASAGIKTFVAMANEKDAGGNVLPTHRTGDHTVDAVLGTRLSAIVSADVPVRYNHRFRLNPDLLPDLEASGLRISARGLSGAVVDAIEVPDHPFFMGMQGHPELSSRPAAPHPLIVAFLQAAAREHQRAASWPTLIRSYQLKESPMRSLFHLAYHVTDLEETRRFYGGVLGCQEGRSTDTWVDFDFFGHQISLHLGKPFETTRSGKVGDHMVMMPHLGVVLELGDWFVLAKRLQDAGTTFDIPPVVRFEGEPGEQRTMFFFDPSGNPIEVKGFKDFDSVFAH